MSSLLCSNTDTVWPDTVLHPLLSPLFHFLLYLLVSSLISFIQFPRPRQKPVLHVSFSTNIQILSFPFFPPLNFPELLPLPPLCHSFPVICYVLL